MIGQTIAHYRITAKLARAAGRKSTARHGFGVLTGRKVTYSDSSKEVQPACQKPIGLELPSPTQTSHFCVLVGACQNQMVSATLGQRLAFGTM